MDKDYAVVAAEKAVVDLENIKKKTGLEFLMRLHMWIPATPVSGSHLQNCHPLSSFFRSFSFSHN